MRFFIQILCLLVFGPSFQALAQSSLCDVRGKTINLMRETCFEGGAQNGRCIYGTEKIKILGQTLLYYWDITKNIGVEYTLGKTRDLLSGADSIQRSMLLGENSTASNTFLTVEGSASYEGGALTVTQQRYRHTAIDRVIPNSSLSYRAGEPVFLDETSISIAIEASCNKCSIRDYRQGVRYIRGPILVQSKMRNSSCTID
jgi:hypothetical protein